MMMTPVRLETNFICIVMTVVTRHWKHEIQILIRMVKFRTRNEMKTCHRWMTHVSFSILLFLSLPKWAQNPIICIANIKHKWQKESSLNALIWNLENWTTDIVLNKGFAYIFTLKIISILPITIHASCIYLLADIIDNWNTLPVDRGAEWKIWKNIDVHVHKLHRCFYREVMFYMKL